MASMVPASAGRRGDVVNVWTDDVLEDFASALGRADVLPAPLFEAAASAARATVVTDAMAKANNSAKQTLRIAVRKAPEIIFSDCVSFTVILIVRRISGES
jgi:hypothetical protein